VPDNYAAETSIRSLQERAAERGTSVSIKKPAPLETVDPAVWQKWADDILGAVLTSQPGSVRSSRPASAHFGADYSFVSEATSGKASGPLDDLDEFTLLEQAVAAELSAAGSKAGSKPSSRRGSGLRPPSKRKSLASGSSSRKSSAASIGPIAAGKSSTSLQSQGSSKIPLAGSREGSPSKLALTSLEQEAEAEDRDITEANVVAARRRWRALTRGVLRDHCHVDMNAFRECPPEVQIELGFLLLKWNRLIGIIMAVEKSRAKDVHHRFDSDGDGRVSRSDVYAASNYFDLGYNPYEANAVFDYLDTNGDDGLDQTEFARHVRIVHVPSEFLAEEASPTAHKVLEESLAESRLTRFDSLSSRRMSKASVQDGSRPGSREALIGGSSPDSTRRGRAASDSRRKAGAVSSPDSMSRLRERRDPSTNSLRTASKPADASNSVSPGHPIDSLQQTSSTRRDHNGKAKGGSHVGSARGSIDRSTLQAPSPVRNRRTTIAAPTMVASTGADDAETNDHAATEENGHTATEEDGRAAADESGHAATDKTGVAATDENGVAANDGHAAADKTDVAATDENGHAAAAANANTAERRRSSGLRVQEGSRIPIRQISLDAEALSASPVGGAAGPSDPEEPKDARAPQRPLSGSAALSIASSGVADANDHAAEPVTPETSSALAETHVGGPVDRADVAPVLRRASSISGGNEDGLLGDDDDVDEFIKLEQQLQRIQSESEGMAAAPGASFYSEPALPGDDEDDEDEEEDEVTPLPSKSASKTSLQAPRGSYAVAVGLADGFGVEDESSQVPTTASLQAPRGSYAVAVGLADGAEEEDASARASTASLGLKPPRMSYTVAVSPPAVGENGHAQNGEASPNEGGMPTVTL
jgi:hypothetical protein